MGFMHGAVRQKYNVGSGRHKHQEAVLPSEATAILVLLDLKLVFLKARCL